MATDKRLDQVSTLTDFDYALIVKGEQVSKVTKQQLAELVGNLLYGATTKETLASVVAGVLGDPIGSIRNLSSNDDLNNINKNGIYSFYAEKGLPINTPAEFDRGCLITFSNAVHSTQLIVGLSEVKIRLGGNNVWYSWMKLN